MLRCCEFDTHRVQPTYRHFFRQYSVLLYCFKHDFRGSVRSRNFDIRVSFFVARSFVSSSDKNYVFLFPVPSASNDVWKIDLFLIIDSTSLTSHRRNGTKYRYYIFLCHYFSLISSFLCSTFVALTVHIGTSLFTEENKNVSRLGLRSAFRFPFRFLRCETDV